MIISKRRRGFGKVVGLGSVLAAGAGAWLFALRPGGNPFEFEATRPVVVASEYTYRPFGDSTVLATVANSGGAGRVRVEVKAYRDKARTRPADAWSAVVHLARGEEKAVVVRLTGFAENGEAYTDTAATPE